MNGPQHVHIPGEHRCMMTVTHDGDEPQKPLSGKENDSGFAQKQAKLTGMWPFFLAVSQLVSLFVFL